MIVLIIYVIICSLFTPVFKKKYGFFANPHNLFILFWSICASLSVINLNNLRDVDIKVHVYGIVFLFTYCVVSRISLIDGNRVKVNNEYVLNLKKINVKIAIVELLALTLYYQYFFQACTALIAGDVQSIRTAYYSSERSFFTLTVPETVLWAVMFVEVFLYHKTKKIRYLINSILLVGVITITSLGRWALLYFIIENAIIVIMVEHKIKLSSKPVLIGIGSIIAVTIIGRNSDLIESFITYFTGSFSFLDYIVSHPNDYGLDKLHYGIITLSPITEPLLYFLKVIGATTEKIPSYWLNENIQEFVDIGNASRIALYNNNATALLPFLLDFGPVGIPIGASFIAILSAIFFKGYLQGKPIYVLLFLLATTSLFTTTMSYQSYMGITPCVFFLVFYFIMHDNNKYHFK